MTVGFLGYAITAYATLLLWHTKKPRKGTGITNTKPFWEEGSEGSIIVLQ
tara:strand:- start:365 stop:514 length:150 start_codon:yes stop_codon:yes gene_type:complete